MTSEVIYKKIVNGSLDLAVIYDTTNEIVVVIDEFKDQIILDKNDLTEVINALDKINSEDL